MGKFGWSYPPGCTGREPGGPEELVPDPSPEEEEVAEILDKQEMLMEDRDRILEIVAELANRANTDCPECEKRQIEAEIKDREKFINEDF